MKKETIITAVVFFIVGFLAGYITDVQLNWSSGQKTAVARGSRLGSEMPAPTGGAARDSTSLAGGTPQNLPEGHPPIDAALITQTLQEEAEKNPRDPEPRLKLANFLYDHQQYTKAIEWYQKALELDPKNVNARTDLGTAYFYTGRPREALGEYRKSLETDPRHEPTLLNTIVVNLEGTHDLAAAQEAWERLHRLNPNNPGLENLKQRLDAARASGGVRAP